MRMFFLLVLVLAASGAPDARFSEDEDGGSDKGTLVGNWSSRNVCHTMFGGLLNILKRANVKTCAKLREKGVYLGR